MKPLRRSSFLIATPAVLLCLALPVQGQQSFRDATDQVNKKMVKLWGAGGFKRLVSYGTGLVVSPRGHILTVNNLLLDTQDLRVHLWDGRKYRAKVLFKEPALDVALIQIDEKLDDLPYFDLAREGDKPLAEAGDWVLAFSNQFRIATREEPMTVQRGTIETIAKLRGRSGGFDAPYRGDVYFIDAITNNPGAAGGALTTRKGELLGIIGRELRNRDSDTYINYAVPIQAKSKIVREGKPGEVNVISFVEESIQGKYRQSDVIAKKGTVHLETGIILVPNVVERTPPYIEEVVAGSPAAAAGLRTDDLIVYLEGERVSTINTFHQLLSNYRPGDKIKLEVERDGKLVGVVLVLTKPREDKDSK